jgi:serine/threonine protein kinase
MVSLSADVLPSPIRFGRYRLLKRIGSGGMAEVFLAEARGIGGFETLLCVKCIRKERAADTDFIRLLVEEAKIVSHIVHPNVAQVFDLGCIDDRYYIAMEYVDGIDAFGILRAASERGIHLPVPAAALIVRELVNGLAAAHGQTDSSGQPLHIIHRDISPHNVLVSFDGDVKIIDFGVAKAALRAATTQAGVIKGKYNYLSPEQARGQPLDHRTDIFSAGIVLFELLAGEPLYPGDQIADLLDQTRRAKVPPLRKFRSDVPKALSAILSKALERNVEKRYASAAAMSADLDAFLAQHAGGYGRGDLTGLLAWLVSEEHRVSAVPPPAPPPAPAPASGARGEPTAKIAHFVDRSRSADELEAEPTRVANPEDILARRRARAAGFEVPPTPILKRVRRRDRRPLYVGLAVLALVLTAGLLAFVHLATR